MNYLSSVTSKLIPVPVSDSSIKIILRFLFASWYILSSCLWSPVCTHVMILYRVTGTIDLSGRCQHRNCRCIRQVDTHEMSLYQTGGHTWTVALSCRWPHKNCRSIKQVATQEVSLYQAGGHTETVALSGRWPHRNCRSMRQVATHECGTQCNDGGQTYWSTLRETVIRMARCPQQT
jgi:hypothetical protein